MLPWWTIRKCWTVWAGLIAIESVAAPGSSEEEPFGPGPAAALKYMLELCASMGFRTKNCDGRVGWAEIGQGDEMVGILCHLDVVPAGTGWDYPPFAMTLVGDRAYGRGTTDDKGPAMCCVYAMKDILNSGVTLKRRIRIIFGLSEETGVWEDMTYYTAHEERPVFGITPDADFPAIYGEKGILGIELRMPLRESGLAVRRRRQRQQCDPPLVRGDLRRCGRPVGDGENPGKARPCLHSGGRQKRHLRHDGAAGGGSRPQ